MAGKEYMSMALPSAVYGIVVPTAIPSIVIAISCHEAWLWMKGILGVLIMWITSVCDQMDSTNQPAWNSIINETCVPGGKVA